MHCYGNELASHDCFSNKEKDKTFLLDAPISKDGLFGDVVTTVVEKFRAAKPQSAVFRQLIPHRSRERHHEVQRSEPSPVAPPHKDWGHRSCPLVCSRQRKQIDLGLSAKAPRSQAPSSSS
ncbi:hypothetical protein H4Q32_026838 [Labeo rohita]|uniref:Uncharacterized protein n=1 Tax=Labeo rohita TaxID=84645 RepID=A0ABQ8L2R0_LABRO|nr:hypothetical protein H4Q32_026838 [Labeo rohita]